MHRALFSPAVIFPLILSEPGGHSLPSKLIQMCGKIFPIYSRRKMVVMTSVRPPQRAVDGMIPSEKDEDAFCPESRMKRDPV